ncbi:MAG TPA: DUF5668 domain-containing protein [Acidobacteriota bacterium]|nr:DUF5668 domain-containing protein [Acidobacteriota bacterium]
MTVRSRSGALTAGLILMSIGLIFFLQNMYEHFSAWRLIARYWPVILIIIGLRKLYDYLTWQETQVIPPASEKRP